MAGFNTFRWFMGISLGLYIYFAFFADQKFSLLRRAPVITVDVPNVCALEGNVGLTFDDGPSQYTTNVLNALQNAGLKSTFHVVTKYFTNVNFVTNMQVAVQQGHVIGLRFPTEQDPSKLTDDEYVSILMTESQKIYKQIGKYPKFLRLPYQSYTDQNVNLATSMGFVVTEASIDSMDYLATITADQMASKYTDQFKTTITGKGRYISVHHDIYAIYSQGNVFDAVASALRSYNYLAVPLDICLQTKAYRDNNVNPKTGSAQPPVDVTTIKAKSAAAGFLKTKMTIDLEEISILLKRQKDEEEYDHDSYQLLPLSDNHTVYRKKLYGHGLLKKTFALSLTLFILLVLTHVLLFSGSSDDSSDQFPFIPSEDIESQFLKIPKAENLKNWLQYFTKKPHFTGTKNDYEQVEFMVEQWKSFGIENVKIETFYPYLNDLEGNQQRLILHHSASEQEELDLKEDAVEEDPSSIQYQNAIPPFHSYSKNGTVKAKYVYANYGTKSDFDQLLNSHVQVNGSICIVRYGKNFRGLKVRMAELYGCVGVLIYSDPKDDGYLKGKVYPDGPWRPESSIQRGSVHYNSIYPGDPLTPEVPALLNATRLKPEETLVLPSIPSLPLSWRNAKKLFQHLENESGQSSIEIELVNHVQYSLKPIWNVIGRIEGTEEPNKVILLGNHRDAWVMGAVDPSSGTAALMELTRAFGQLLKQGWRSKRTILFCSWDAEEVGIVGSTEHVELNRQWLSEEAVVYLNVDSGVSGPIFDVQSTPSLNELLKNVTHLIRNPNTGISLYEEWQKDSQLSIRPLGSGSDFIGFSSYLGIPSLAFGFRGPYGVYHSNYDSFHWITKFGDVDFSRHLMLTQLWGLLVLKLSEERVLGLRFMEYAEELEKSVLYLEQKLKNSDQPRIFFKLWESIEILKKSAEVIQQEIQTCTSDSQLENINHRLQFAERLFLKAEGLRNRKWFKHILYAPGLWTGYAGSVFPELDEAVESVNETGWQLIREIELEISEKIKQVASFLLPN